MFTKSFNTAVVALAASSLVSAQTFTDCDPTKKSCPADPAFGKNGVNCDLTKGKCAAFDNLPGTTVTYDGKGALFTIQKESNAPTQATHKRMCFGELEVELQAAQGQGIVTSVVLESADLDEIDWEWVGGDNEQVQTNYYGKGDTTTYDRGRYHPVDSPLTKSHVYKIHWTKDAMTWSVDGNPIRTVTYEEAKGGKEYPQTPMEVKIGTWVGGGKNSPEGTVEWAGGYTDFSQAPFNAWYKSIKIVDYGCKDAPTDKEIKEYVWTDKSGSWESIKPVYGSGGSDDDDDDGNHEKPVDKTTSKPDPKPTKTEDEEKPEKTETTEKTKSSTTKESTTTTPSPSTTAATPTPTNTEDGSEESGSPSASSPDGGATGAPDNDDAATGIFASFGRVVAAGAAAVLVAQLF
ncbi:glycosidase-like protein [Hapsidospora chrysogenum ATCC 11550]|uniref:Crh-like protein n=1 Tax=Hapsidospora chrysogenum (strain ATCC 11550 / CBS 779.69 / DSM 880 / IAM 14645 / JCM 23072 / IMI 49137) TaxID=857340 RepID=A0A086T428_HAPC1|nr:glycosidase-like protein [Hapsidospora chrysogenum ATCC 11550]